MQLFFANYYLIISKILNNRHLEVCLNQVATTILIFSCESVRKDKIIMESRLMLLLKYRTHEIMQIEITVRICSFPERSIVLKTMDR